MNKSLRVLILEDHQDLNDMASIVLKTRGHQPVPALSAKAALEELKNGHFDLILVDLSLPDMDPKDFFQHLKADPKLNKIPLLLASGRTDIDEWARNLGVPKLMKPYDLDSLIQKVESAATAAQAPSQ